MFNKMTSKAIDLSEQTPIIRALIAARGPKGAKIEELKRDYKNQVGVELEYGKDDRSLQMWLENINDIKTVRKNGVAFYISESSRQQHLVKMIRHQKVRKSEHKNAQHDLYKPEFSSCHEHSSEATPKTWTNSLIFRRSQLMGKTFVDNKSISIEKCNHQYSPCHSLIQPKPPQAPKINSRDTSFDHSRNFISGQERHCHVNDTEVERNENNIKHLDDCLDVPCASDYSSDFADEDDEVNPCLPEFFKCILVGDNFLLNLAVMDLGYRMVNHDRVLQSGFCVSGQTIAEATKNIKKIAGNQIILLNIGSADIIQGKELIEMIYETVHLLRVCLAKGITPVLTTLLPLANYRLGNRVEVADGFNEFLIKNPFKFSVIELHKAFSNSDGSMDSNYYQPNTRYVSGMKRPLVFWNRLGRKKIIKTLTKELGSAILKILIE